MRSWRSAWVVATVSLLLAVGVAQQFPRLQEQNLNGQQVVLPEAASGKIAVLVLGFTRSSQNPCGAWAKRVLDDFGKSSGVVLYQLPVLEDAPRPLHGMIVSGIKKGVPENVRGTFVPVMHDEAALKKLVGWSESSADDAYVILLDRNGAILFQTHGATPDPAYAALHSKLQSLLK